MNYTSRQTFSSYRSTLGTVCRLNSAVLSTISLWLAAQSHAYSWTVPSVPVQSLMSTTLSKDICSLICPILTSESSILNNLGPELNNVATKTIYCFAHRRFFFLNHLPSFIKLRFSLKTSKLSVARSNI